MYSVLYPNAVDKNITVLKSLPNVILKLNPQMIVNDRFDNQMQSALIKFKFQNNLFPPDATIDVKTSECIKQLLPVERLQQILNESAKSNSSAAFEINSMLRKLIFQRIQQQQTTLDETPIDGKTLDDLRSYLVNIDD